MVVYREFIHILTVALMILWMSFMLIHTLIIKPVPLQNTAGSFIIVLPGPPVSSLSGFSLLFNQRTNHLFCCVNQTTESWFYYEIYETCKQRDEYTDGTKKESLENKRVE